jgi:YD repeat-containing protein
MTDSADAFGNAWINEYDLVGRVKTRWDPRGVKTGYRYDALGRLEETRVARQPGVDPIAAADGDVLRTRYEYDKNGNQSAVVDGRGYRYAYEYDSLNMSWLAVP